MFQLMTDFVRDIAFQVVPDLRHEIRAGDQLVTPFALPLISRRDEVGSQGFA